MNNNCVIYSEFALVFVKSMHSVILEEYKSGVGMFFMFSHVFRCLSLNFEALFPRSADYEGKMHSNEVRMMEIVEKNPVLFQIKHTSYEFRVRRALLIRRADT